MGGVRWLLDDDDPTRLAGARLVVSPVPAEVRVRVGADGPWTACATRGTAVTCAFARPLPRVRAAGSLEVVALG